MNLVQRSARVESPLGPLTVHEVAVTGPAPPPDVIAVVDLSGSLAGPPGEHALRAAQALLAALPDSRHGALVLAASPPLLAAPLGPLGAQRAAIAAAPRRAHRGATTVARALDLVELELARSQRPAVVVVFSDLAWGTDVAPALGRVESRGAATIVVEATSAFTPPSPARAPRFVLGLRDESARLPGLEEAVRASEPAPPRGTLGVELDGAPPLAWFVANGGADGGALERAAPGASLVARASVELGAARLAFVTAGEPRGSVLLALAGEKLARSPLQASAPLDVAGALVQAALAPDVGSMRGGAP